MSRFRWIFFCVVCAPSLLPIPSHGKNVTQGRARGHSTLAPLSLGFWIGVSFDSPDRQFLGTTKGRDYHELGFRLTWQIAASHPATLEYTLDLMPLVILTDNPVYSAGPVRRSGEQTREVSGYEAKYGIGAAPFGFKLNIVVSKQFSLFAAASGGVEAFDGRVPTYDASNFNFIFNFGGGMEFRSRSQRTLFLGYKLHHISNAGIANENPGIDTNSFYAGITWSL